MNNFFFLTKIIPQPFKSSEHVPMGKEDMEIFMIVWPIMLILIILWLVKMFRK